MIEAEDVLDLGSGTFLNIRPSAFDHASKPSCEFRSVAGGDAKGEPDLCLLASTVASYPLHFHTLASGCWLFLESQPFTLRGQCSLKNNTEVRLSNLSPISLFRPQCGCTYSSHEPVFRELPISWHNCVTKSFSLSVPR